MLSKASLFTAIAVLLGALYFGASPGVADEQSPRDIYLRSLAKMHDLPDRAYLQFNYSWKQEVDGKIDTGTWNVLIRTADGKSRLDKGANNVVDGHFGIRPDLLIGHPSPAPNPSPASSAFQVGLDIDATAKLPTIAVVVSRPLRYRVTLLAEQSDAQCPAAYHLGLDPISDPVRNNVRELWVDKTTYQVCKAAAVWGAGEYMGHRFPVTFTLHFNDEGFITDWVAEGTARSLVFKADYRDVGTYSDLKQLDESPIANWQ